MTRREDLTAALVCGAFAAAAALLLVGCSTAIAKDTELSLKGPKAEVKRTF